MLYFIKQFRAEETGAVSTDWVVLTAAIVSLGLVVAASIKTGAIDGGNDISAQVAGMVTP